MKEHFFNFDWKNPPRTTKKAEWKAVNRFLRVTRNTVEKKLPIKKIEKCLVDAMLYGTGILFLG